MRDLLESLEQEHKQLVAELSGLEVMDKAIATQSQRIDSIEQEAQELMQQVKTTRPPG